MKITFIGGGNMASSLIGGLVPEQFKKNEVCVFDINAETLESIKQRFSVETSLNLSDALNKADIVMLAVKPQILQTVCQRIKETIATKPLFISIAAGIRSDSINEWLGGEQAIVRCMPNTPSLLQCGATGLFANINVSDEQKQLSQIILEAVGVAVWVNDENEIDIVTAVSGSGPAYFFMFIEALQEAGIKLGLEAEVANKLATQTALGAANMALVNTDIEKLRNNVTSKGGTTEQALLSLSKSNLKLVVSKAVNAAYKRSQQMAEELSQTK